MPERSKAVRANILHALREQLKRAVQLAQALGADAGTIAEKTGIKHESVVSMLEVHRLPYLAHHQSRTAENVEFRRQKAVELHADGWSLKDIAEYLGYKSHTSIIHLLKTAD